MRQDVCFSLQLLSPRYRELIKLSSVKNTMSRSCHLSHGRVERKRRFDEYMRPFTSKVIIFCFLLACFDLAAAADQPNIIIMQPDDLPFFEEWTPPPNTPNAPARGSQTNKMPSVGMPNIERLRKDGMQMMEAYAASPMCGTSRYTTITGRYASRSATSRAASSGKDRASVVIPQTKLEDVAGYGNDCSEDNIAVQFRNNGYTTGMFGKWHLSRIDEASYSYPSAVETVQGCGFDTVGSLYVENLAGGRREFNAFSDGSFSHNMEHMTYEAINFIKDAADSDTPFFAYFNPTIVHSSNSIGMALNDFSCRDTSQGTLTFGPVIPGLVEEGDNNCEIYRESIKSRANSEDDYGPIWLDDSVGALLNTLEEKGVLEDTIFLFQEDHGQESKGTVFENGLHIPQFIYYPGTIPGGTRFVGPVSTVDVGPTMLDFAGITPLYEMDGKSWKDSLVSKSLVQSRMVDRCIFFEHEQDRAVRCGCSKYISINEESINDSTSTTYQRGGRQGLAIDVKTLYNLCDQSGNYESDPEQNGEAINLVTTNPDEATKLEEMLQCHIDRTSPSDRSDYKTCNEEKKVVVEPEKPELTKAPAVRGITSTSVIIKIQTSMAAKSKIIYSTRRGLQRKRRKSTRYIKTRAANGFSKSIKISGLKPGKRYWYRIFVKGGKQDRKKRSFTTLPN